MAPTSGSDSNTSTASLSPLITFKTPLGAPASNISSAKRMPQDGSRSDGFKMKVFPVANAIGNIHMGTIAGKLKGVIPAHTPTGWRIDITSTPFATLSEYSPLSKCGMPQANSTTSKPRVIEPLASSKVLPCSVETKPANSSIFLMISSRNLNKT